MLWSIQNCRLMFMNMNGSAPKMDTFRLLLVLPLNDHDEGMCICSRQVHASNVARIANEMQTSHVQQKEGFVGRRTDVCDATQGKWGICSAQTIHHYNDRSIVACAQPINARMLRCSIPRQAETHAEFQVRQASRVCQNVGTCRSSASSYQVNR